jgi:hypothetical protein
MCSWALREPSVAERGPDYADLCRAYNRACHERDHAERRVGETYRAMLTADPTLTEATAHG